MKALITYFSCSGVTKSVAEQIAKRINADLFEIVPAVPYTEADLDWTNSRSRSTVEMQDSASRPAIASRVENIDEYDTVFVGFPIWWYVAPTIVNTFLESYDLSKKTVAPFCTSGGSEVGKTDSILHGLCTVAKWIPCQRLSARPTAEEIDKWIKRI